MLTKIKHQRGKCQGPGRSWPAITETSQWKIWEAEDSSTNKGKLSGKEVPSFDATLTGVNYSRSPRGLGDETAVCKIYSPKLTLAFCLAQFSHSRLNRCLERKERSHLRHCLISRDLWVSLANIGSLLVSSHISYRSAEGAPRSTVRWCQWSSASVE